MRFSDFIVKQSLSQSKADYNLFMKSNDKQFTVFLIYADDIIVVRNDTNTINELKVKMDSEFKIKDLGNLKHLFGIKVARSNQDIYICQRKYALDLLKDTKMLGEKTFTLLLDQNTKFFKDQEEPIPNPKVSGRLIGMLMYLTLPIQNLAYSIQVLSQFI